MKQVWVKKGVILKRTKKNELLKYHLGPTSIYKINNNILKILFSPRNNENQSQICLIKYNIKTKKKSIKKILKNNKKNKFENLGVSYPFVFSENNLEYLFYVGWSKDLNYNFKNFLFFKKNKKINFGNPQIKAQKVFKKDSNIGNGSCCILKVNKIYYMWFTNFISAGEKKHNLRYRYLIQSATSKDLKKWEINKRKCIKFKSNDEIAISKPTVIYRNKKFHMWFCYRGKNYKIGYAYSMNGVDWKRKDNDLIFKGKKNKWDNESMCYPTVTNFKNKLIMLYSGNSYGKDGIGYYELKDFKL